MVTTKRHKSFCFVYDKKVVGKNLLPFSVFSAVKVLPFLLAMFVAKGRSNSAEGRFFPSFFGSTQQNWTGSKT